MERDRARALSLRPRRPRLTAFYSTTGFRFFFSFYDSEVAALRRQFRPAPVSCCLATDQPAGHAPSAVAMAAEPAW